MSDHLIAEANRHARALIIERDQLRTELALLREWQREVIQNANAHHAERKDAIARAETERNNLRADLDAIKAILTEEKARAERAEAELAAERARLRIVEEFMLRRHIPQAEDDYPQIWLGNGYFDTLADAADAAMKEGAK